MNLKPILLILCLLLSTAFARPTLIIVDASGSMGDRMADGTVKLDAAKMAAKQLVQNANDEIALMVYTDCDTGGDPKTGSIKVVTDFTTDKQALISEIDKLTSESSTPISDAIKEGATYVASSGKNAGIVLLTDGEETCGTLDANQLATVASQSGVQIINVVGFQLSSTARNQMEGLASAAGGHYYDANDTASLTASMQQAYGSASGGSCCAPAAMLLAVCCGAIVVGRRK